MKKKTKILTSLSLSLVSLPLIAASCKKEMKIRVKWLVL
ncbi:variable surface lipoprotein [Mycoplasmopsis agalactiae]